MFVRLLCVLVTTSSVIAAGIHPPRHAAAGSSGACSTGPIQCCESTAAADSPSGSAILALIGMPFEETTGLIGFNCNPIYSGGVSGPSCQQSPVCCANNNVGGFFSMGCAPFIL
ncbi:hypothetical protein V8D89_009264 [Ganoderma adspersum]